MHKYKNHNKKDTKLLQPYWNSKFCLFPKLLQNINYDQQNQYLPRPLLVDGEVCIFSQIHQFC